MVRKERATIKDVAKAAGVSTQTISRVLNDRPDVSPKTRALVKQIIEELGYSPNAFARSLSRGRSNTLGVVAFGLVYFGSSSVLTGIEKKANELGYSLSLILINRMEPARVDQVLYDLLSRRVEGMIWAVPGDLTSSDWLTEKFSEIQTPVVYINKGQTGSDHIAALNNQLGGKLAAQHLFEQGYQRIGIITGPGNWWEADQRLEGWRQVVESEGYTNTDDLIVEGDWNAPSGDVGFHTLLNQAPDVDAVFVCNDQMALGTLEATRRLGLNVPEDIGIVGFDDIPEAAYYYPSLTTVRQNPNKLGALAVEKISTLIKAHHQDETLEPHSDWVEPRLIVRKSSVRHG
jgi:DNA-binding LacI/PurR family transcriptional regulator